MKPAGRRFFVAGLLIRRGFSPVGSPNRPDSHRRAGGTQSAVHAVILGEEPMRARILFVASVAGVLAIVTGSGTGRAQSAVQEGTFATVDSIEETDSGFVMTVTGTLVGETQPTSIDVQVGNADSLASGCRTMALLAFDHPGKFLLRIRLLPQQGIFPRKSCTISRNGG